MMVDLGSDNIVLYFTSTYNESLSSRLNHLYLGCALVRNTFGNPYDTDTTD